MIIIIIIIIITIIMKLKKISNSQYLHAWQLCYDMKYKIMSISNLYFTFWKSLHKMS